MALSLVVSCEHATNRVPRELRRHFRGQRRLLASHRAYDRGALLLARAVAGRFQAPLICGGVTRLVVDLNRSLTHRHLFSSVTGALDATTREAILRRWYHPYRQEVQDRIEELVEGKRRVVHLSVHSFAPVLAGKARRADLGLLYDPKRAHERKFCRRLKEDLCDLSPGLRVRRNYPYRGVADGFTSFLRKRYLANKYLGVEFEVNQRWTFRENSWKRLESRILAALEMVSAEDL